MVSPASGTCWFFALAPCQLYCGFSSVPLLFHPQCWATGAVSVQWLYRLLLLLQAVCNLKLHQIYNIYILYIYIWQKNGRAQVNSCSLFRSLPSEVSSSQGQASVWKITEKYFHTPDLLEMGITHFSFKFRGIKGCSEMSHFHRCSHDLPNIEHLNSACMSKSLTYLACSSSFQIFIWIYANSVKKTQKTKPEDIW